jgi:hypothetical protein
MRKRKDAFYRTFLKGLLMITTSLNEKEIANDFRLSLSKVRQDRMRGKGFPYVKIGKSVRYNIDDIYEYLTNNKYPKQQV